MTGIRPNATRSPSRHTVRNPLPDSRPVPWWDAPQPALRHIAPSLHPANATVGCKADCSARPPRTLRGAPPNGCSAASGAGPGCSSRDSCCLTRAAYRPPPGASDEPPARLVRRPRRSGCPPATCRLAAGAIQGATRSHCTGVGRRRAQHPSIVTAGRSTSSCSSSAPHDLVTTSTCSARRLDDAGGAMVAVLGNRCRYAIVGSGVRRASRTNPTHHTPSAAHRLRAIRFVSFMQAPR